MEKFPLRGGYVLIDEHWLSLLAHPNPRMRDRSLLHAKSRDDRSDRRQAQRPQPPRVRNPALLPPAPGRALEAGEMPPAELRALVADQLESTLPPSTSTSDEIKRAASISRN